jgi:hypothetical protein
LSLGIFTPMMSRDSCGPTASRSIFADHRSGRERRLSVARDPLLPLQDAERRRLGRHEASADHLRPRLGQPAAVPKMRQGGQTPGSDPAAAGLAAAAPTPGDVNRRRHLSAVVRISWAPLLIRQTEMRASDTPFSPLGSYGKLRKDRCRLGGSG